jgi:hypothetical protein
MCDIVDFAGRHDKANGKAERIGPHVDIDQSTSGTPQRLFFAPHFRSITVDGPSRGVVDHPILVVCPPSGRQRPCTHRHDINSSTCGGLFSTFRSVPADPANANRVMDPQATVCE